MPTFALAVAALIALAVAMVSLLPRLWHRSGRAETNADWLILRQRELEGDTESLKQDAALRVVEEGDVSPDALETAAPQYVWWVQCLGAALLIAGAGWLYLALGAWEDVEIAEQLARIESAQPEDVIALIDRIENRAEARKANTDYALLLAEYYLSGNEPAAAARYFERLIAAGATAPEILGKAAQAEFLAADRVLSQTARLRAEQALAVDPAQSAALATLGMAAFEEADYRGAITYWQRLRALEAPGSPGHAMLGQVIARAEQELARAGGLASTPPTAASPSPMPADEGVISVQVMLPTELSAPTGSVMFVLARPAGAEAGMPIAVVREPVDAWPTTVTLSDATSMAGQSLSDFTSVSVEVQISLTGQPGRDNAWSWARRDNIMVGANEPVHILLSRD